MEVALDFLNETKELENIAACLRVLYSTPIGSVALDRDFGLDWSFLDLSLPAARARLESELIQKTRKYEPRVQVQEVQWEFDGKNGKMKAKAVIRIV